MRCQFFSNVSRPSVARGDRQLSDVASDPKRQQQNAHGHVDDDQRTGCPKRGADVVNLSGEIGGEVQKPGNHVAVKQRLSEPERRRRQDVE